jgi:hypothetical protein
VRATAALDSEASRLLKTGSAQASLNAPKTGGVLDKLTPRQVQDLTPNARYLLSKAGMADNPLLRGGLSFIGRLLGQGNTVGSYNPFINSIDPGGLTEPWQYLHEGAHYLGANMYGNRFNPLPPGFSVSPQQQTMIGATYPGGTRDPREIYAQTVALGPSAVPLLSTKFFTDVFTQEALTRGQASAFSAANMTRLRTDYGVPPPFSGTRLPPPR